MQVNLPVDDGLSAVSDARRAVASQLRSWGVYSVLDSAELVVSELLTNARIHTAGPVQISVIAIDNGVRIEVKDNAPHVTPSVGESTVEDTTGRGLTIVNALSADWGVERHKTGGGKTVWAELSLADGS